MRRMLIFVSDSILFSTMVFLISNIIKTESVKGFSGKMHTLNLFTFTAGWAQPDDFDEDLFMKILLSITSLAMIYLIYVKYKKTLEAECDKFWIEAVILFTLLSGIGLSPDMYSPASVLSTFSLFLEGFIVMPQVYFTYKKEESRMGVSLYILAIAISRIIKIYDFTQQSVVNTPEYSGLFEILACALYCLVICTFKKKTEKELPITVPLPIRTQLNRSESLLETPFLKRSMPSSTSIYTISSDSQSTPSTPAESLDLEEFRFPIDNSEKY